MLTLDELKERVVQYYDVITLCDLLDISEEDLLDRFEDRFLDIRDTFEKDFGDNDSGYYQEETE